jgi:hypothetical protein
MARHPALLFDPMKLGQDHLNRLIRDDSRFAAEAQDATEPRDPLQSGDAGRREITSHKKVGREQRHSTRVRPRGKEREKRRKTASCQDVGHP